MQYHAVDDDYSSQKQMSIQVKGPQKHSVHSVFHNFTSFILNESSEEKKKMPPGYSLTLLHAFKYTNMPQLLPLQPPLSKYNHNISSCSLAITWTSWVMSELFFNLNIKQYFPIKDDFIHVLFRVFQMETPTGPLWRKLRVLIPPAPPEISRTFWPYLTCEHN